MTLRGHVLENHSLVVRDGRILDIFPTPASNERYAATAVLRRPVHLLMPGMVNAHTHAAMSLFRAIDGYTSRAPVNPPLEPYEPSASDRLLADAYRVADDPPQPAAERRFIGPEFVRDGVLAAIAEMLQSGITCFADRYYFPDETARVAIEQGMRAVVGSIVTDSPNPWAQTAADCLTRALNMRDEYRGHPLISTVFAPVAAHTLSDAAVARIATLADELDAGVMVDLHRSSAEVAESLAQRGVRPIERLWNAGLLTPALNAVHMVHATAADIDLAQRTGMSISLCPQSNLRDGHGLAPAAMFAASGIRMGLGSGGGRNQDIWNEMKLIALTAHASDVHGAAGARGIRDGAAVRTGGRLSAWDALDMATRGAAAALGLDTDVGTLEPGKWADLCCVDLGGPATQPLGDPVAQLVFCGGRDLVTDVWVAGRQLLSDGELTRLDWPGVAARAEAWATRLRTGG